MATSSFNTPVHGGHDSQLDWDAFLRQFGLETDQSELNEDFILQTQYAATEQLPGPYEFTAPPASSSTSRDMMTQYFAQSLGGQPIFGQPDADSSQNIYNDAYFSAPLAAEEQVPRSQRDITTLEAWSSDAIDRLSRSVAKSLEAIFGQSFPDENPNYSYNGALPTAEQQFPGQYEVRGAVTSSTSRGIHVTSVSSPFPVQPLTAPYPAYPVISNTPAQYIQQHASSLPERHVEEAASSSTAVSTRTRAPLQPTQPSTLPPSPPVLPRASGSRSRRGKTSPRAAPYRRSQRSKKAKNESNSSSSSPSSSPPLGSAASSTDSPNLSDLAFLLHDELYKARVLPDYFSSFTDKGHSAGISFPMPGLAILPHRLPSQQAYEGMSKDVRPLWDAIVACHEHGLNAHTIGGILRLFKPRQAESFRHAVGSVETCRWRGCNAQFPFQHAARSGSERESDENMLKRVYGEMEEHIAQVHGTSEKCGWIIGRGKLVDRSGWHGEGNGAEGTQEGAQEENEIICGTSRRDSKGIKRCLWAHLHCRALCWLCNGSFARDDELRRHGPICPAKNNSDDGMPMPPGWNAPSPDENRPPDAAANHSSRLNNAMHGHFSYC